MMSHLRHILVCMLRDNKVLLKSYLRRGVLPTLPHNQALKKRVLKSLQKVDIAPPNVLFIGKGATVMWDSESHDAVISRLVRDFTFIILIQ